MKGGRTKEAVIETALQMAIADGLEGLTFGTLSKQAGLSKSGLFAHFSSKTDLQLSVLDHALGLFRTDVIAAGTKAEPGLERLRVLYSKYLDWIAGTCSVSADPFAGFVQEFDGRPGELREKLVTSQTEWRNQLTRNVRKSQSENKQLRQDPPDQIAFELIGAAQSFQVALNLLDDDTAREKADAAFDSILS